MVEPSTQETHTVVLTEAELEAYKDRLGGDLFT
jgi:hypothetical protein